MNDLHPFHRVQIQIDNIEDDTEELAPMMHSSGASLFQDLEATRGSSWQYELQQLKLANQRLHEELKALEGACTQSGTGSSSSTTGLVPLGQCRSSASTAVLNPAAIHAADAFDSVHVLTLAAFTQRVARAARTIFRLIFARWCAWARTESS